MGLEPGEDEEKVGHGGSEEHQKWKGLGSVKVMGSRGEGEDGFLFKFGGEI